MSILGRKSGVGWYNSFMGSDRKDSRRARYRLPELLPIFPLGDALLLPGCRLPLTIFEPRYLQMVEDALSGDRLIGMIQPVGEESEDHDPPIEQVGCAGRIASMKEVDDGRYQVHLIGISRFEVAREIYTDKLYRIVEPTWKRFAADLRAHREATIDREELVANLRAYFDARGLEANWRAIDESGNEELVNSLAMVCPFDSTEKQALLEARNLEERSRLVIALMNMAVLHGDMSSSTLH